MSDQFLGSLIFLGVVGIVTVNALKLGTYLIREIGRTVNKALDSIVKIHNATNRTPRPEQAVNEVSHSIDHAVRPEQAVNTVSRREPKLADNVIDVEATEVRSSDRKSSQQKKERSVDSSLPRTAEDWAKYESPALRRKLVAASA